MPRLQDFRFPLSTADVEDLLAERGVTVSRETIRQWVNRFGGHFAKCIRSDLPQSNDKWHLDKVAIPINTVFRPRRYRLSTTSYGHARTNAFGLWDGHIVEMNV